jgi:hypothetical protein
MKNLFLALLVMGFMAFGACSKSSTGPTSSNTPSFKVTIKGNAWTANAIFDNTSWSSGDTTLFIAGKDTITGKEIVLGVSPYLGKAGTFVISSSSASSIYVDSNSTTLGSAIYGQVVLTSVNSSSIQGTFSFTCFDSTKYTSGSFTAPGGL